MEKKQEPEFFDVITFNILGIPKPKQSARFSAFSSGGKTFVRSYQSSDVKQNERNIQLDIKRKLPKDFVPYDGPLYINVTFIFPPLKSFKKKQREMIEKGEVIYKTTKPDLTDNLMKGLCDAMNGIVWIDDALIARVSSVKIYGKVPQTIIAVHKIKS